MLLDLFFAKLRILKLIDIYKNQISCLMWDYEHGSLPKSFNKYFISLKDTHTYKTRNADDNKLSLNMAVNTSTHGKTMFKYQGCRLYNELIDLPFYLPYMKKGTFKKKYKLHLIGSYH